MNPVPWCDRIGRRVSSLAIETCFKRGVGIPNIYIQVSRDIPFQVSKRIPVQWRIGAFWIISSITSSSTSHTLSPQHKNKTKKEIKREKPLQLTGPKIRLFDRCGTSFHKTSSEIAGKWRCRRYICGHLPFQNIPRFVMYIHAILRARDTQRQTRTFTRNFLRSFLFFFIFLQNVRR